MELGEEKRIRRYLLSRTGPTNTSMKRRRECHVSLRRWV